MERWDSLINHWLKAQKGGLRALRAFVVEIPGENTDYEKAAKTGIQ